jgi:hypothetical protein
VYRPDPVLNDGHVDQSLAFCVVYCRPLYWFLLAIVLTVLRRLTFSDNSFGIFKLSFFIHLVFSNFPCSFIWYFQTFLVHLFSIFKLSLFIHLVFSNFPCSFIWYFQTFFVHSFGIFKLSLFIHLVFSHFPCSFI